MKTGIVVMIEQREGQVKRASLEALTRARQLQHDLGGRVACILVGSGVASAAQELATRGVDAVMVADAPFLATYSPEGYASAALQAIKSVDPGLVLVAATIQGRDLAPAIAARMGAAYIADCTSLEFNDGRVVARRPVYAGKAVATVAPTGESVVVSLRPNVVALDLPEAEGPAPIEPLDPGLTADDLRSRVTEVKAAAAGRKDVSEADVVVAGGRGAGTPEGFAVIEELAAVLGGAVGASRAVVDLGWRPHSEQVGQTGKVVSPKLYIAAGVSGAIQHLAGMRTSKVIVAINKDPEAPIFKVADYGIVGDLSEVLPALSAALRG